MSKLRKTSPEDQQNQQTSVVLYDIDDENPHHCGYCDSNGNISIGMSCDSMLIEDYQLLIDRGWRRSGTYIYKPVMNKTCCPLYTIKCDALKFELRKSQKKTLIKVKNFLLNDEKKEPKIFKTKTNSNKSLSKISSVLSSDYIENRINQNRDTHALKIMKYFLNKNNEFSQIESLTPNKILNIPKVKAKHRRLFEKLKKLKQKNLIHNFSDIEKCLKRKLKKPEDDLIENYLMLDEKKTPKNKLEIKLVRSWPPSKEFQNSLKEEHILYTKYQMTIHQDTKDECGINQFQRFLCTSPLMAFSYNGPLKNIKHSEILERDDINHELIGDVTSLGYGSFHQQYILNGKIIAVGVIDILNQCVSSVYFFYDPDYQFLNLGNYSALREIEFVRQLNKLDPEIKSYYLGFYVHACPKMRYKGFFYPSFLLCPEVYTWHPIEYCVPLLNKNKYSRFAPNENNSENNEMITKDLNENESINNVRIRLGFKNSEMQIFKFEEFCDKLNANYVPHFTHLISGYCKLFGKKFSEKVLIKF